MIEQLFFYILIFKDAKQPSPGNGTLIAVPLLTAYNPSMTKGGWRAKIVESKTFNLKVEVYLTTYFIFQLVNNEIKK